MTDNKSDKKVIREFKLTSLALKNKNTVYLLAIILLFFGIYSYRSLPKELMPEIVWPQIMVQTVYPGNSPEDIENLVTRPLEKELENVRGLKEITSISAQDASMIFVEFNTDVDIEDALRRVKDGVDIGKNELPPEIESQYGGPLVFDLDFTEFPIININLSGEYSIEELKFYAEQLQDEFESIPEVSKALIEGVNDREIKVNVDLHKLEALEISFFDISAAIKNENISMSGGEILLGQTRRSIRTVGEFEDIEALKNIIIKSDNGKNVYLKDVAEVIDGYAEPKSFARLNKNSVVSIQVVKKGGENLLSTTDQIYAKLDAAKKAKIIPDNLEISITDDQSVDVKSQLSALENSMIMGVIFVIVVLFFFLGTRNALFVGLAIPMSMFISFVVIGAIDFRINFIVLFSLILALGMLVDNAIVVVENIYRYVDKGYNPWQAAKEAVGEIAIPIIASTATTLAAFFPLVLWDSIIGEFMKYLPITLIIVLTSSLFVALVIIPVVVATFIKPSAEDKNNNTKKQKRKALMIAISMFVIGFLFVLGKVMVFGNLLMIFGFIGILHKLFLQRLESWFQDIFLTKLERVYSRVLHYALKGKRLLLFFGGTMMLLIITIMLFFSNVPDVVFFPNTDPKQVNVIVKLPEGTDITATNELVNVIEEDVTEFYKPYVNKEGEPIVESILTTVGKGDPYAIGEGGKPNEAIIIISFIDFEFRGKVSTSTMLSELSSHMMGKYPGIELEVSPPQDGPPTGKPINLEIIGQDFDQLIHLADTIKNIIDLQNIAGIEGLRMNISTQNPELLIHIDRDKAQRYGLSTIMIANTLRQSLFGDEVSDFKVGEDEYPIMIRLKNEYRYNLPAMMNMKIPVFGDGPPSYIPLSAVASYEYSTTFSSIRRKDLDRVITLYSNVIEGYNANTINMQIAGLMEEFDMPGGYRYEFTGEQQEQDESSEFLANAMIIALALILLILVTQFNSIIRTLIILTSVLFSTIGVFGGLWTFKMDFVIIMTGIGIISLAGIVVNNAIVLIDYIELLKARKRKELGLAEHEYLPVSAATECIIEGGKTRLRPVLLTAITTILGLLPMAIGLNFDFKGLFSSYDPNIYFGGDNAAYWGPMSWTVIFGLTFSTFLTLVIVPVMYRMTVIAQKRIMGIKDNIKTANNK